MISPNATRPSVSRSRRWYSTWTGGAVRRGGRRRGFGGGSGGTRSLPSQTAERLSAVLVVPELVEAGAGGREQHGVAGAGVDRGGPHGGLERARPLGRDSSGVEGRSEALRRLSDQIDARDGAGGDGPGQAGEVGALQRSAEDQVHAGRERRQRLNRRVGVGRLGVVHELDTRGAGDGLEPLRQPSELAQGAVDVGGVDAGGPGRGGRRDRVLEVVVAAKAGVLPVDLARVGPGDRDVLAVPGKLDAAQGGVVAVHDGGVAWALVLED